MDKIKAKKVELESEKFNLQYKKENSIPKASIEKSIRDYCKQVDRKLNTIEGDFDSKRHLLTLALNRVIIDGKKVRIKGIIPTIPQEVGGIASTSAEHCEHKPAFEYELVAILP